MILKSALFILIGSVLMTAYILPKIVGVARYKELMDKPNGRSSHEIHVPRLGGVAFFVTLMLALYFIQLFFPGQFITSLTPSLTILFVIGLKDDLVVLTPKSKFITQLIAATFLVFDQEIAIREFHGFLGFYEVHPIINILLVYVIVTGIINSLNLIDGIDGLASGVGLVGLTSLAAVFFIVGKDFAFLLMISMIGCLLAFLPYNFSEKRNKIFMGDTGAMILGFILSFGVINSLNLSSEQLNALQLPKTNIPFLMMFILFVPVMDTLRVMSVRMIRSKGPFKPDRTHLHHYFLDTLDWSHAKTMLVITISAMLIALMGYGLCYYLNGWLLMGFFIVMFVLSILASFKIYRNKVSLMKKVDHEEMDENIAS